MAAATVAITVLAKGTIQPSHPPKNTGDWDPWPTSKPVRYAMVKLVTDAGDYAAGGVACNLLGALSGWTRIDGVTNAVTTINSVAQLVNFSNQNDGTAGNRKMTVNVVSTGAEHAASALSAATIYVTVFGY